MNLSFRKGIALAPGLSVKGLKLHCGSRTWPIHIPLWQKIACLGPWGRIGRRLFRVAPRVAIRLSEGKYLISQTTGLYLLDNSEKELKEIWTVPKGWSQVLSITKVDNQIYWGDYGANQEGSQVKIYRWNENEGAQVVYEFPSGAVRHIHNLVFDEHKNGFWILTGDTEKNAGIYFSDIDFSKISPIAVGEQKFRAVVGFPYDNGLMYATDAVESENHIYKLADVNHKCSKEVMSIEGSCIYGVELKNFYIFSTTVEPHEGRGMKGFLSNDLGDGIKSCFATLVAVKKTTGEAMELLRFKKDLFPMKLFQYGAITFPSGQEYSDTLTFNITALKKFDDNHCTIDVDEMWNGLRDSDLNRGGGI